jgi:hypothetical protein
MSTSLDEHGRFVDVYILPPGGAEIGTEIGEI